MGRGFWGGVAALAATLALGVSPAAADDTPSLPLPLDANLMLQQLQAPNLGALTALLAELPLPGEVLEDPLVVTDEELLSVGTSAWVVEAPVSTTTSAPADPVVDDDLQQCPNAQFTSIQLAVTATPPGGRVRVCPGLYMESVNVPASKPGLLITGAASRDSNCPSDGANDQTKYAIVQPPAGNGFTLDADNVTLEKFVVRNAPSGFSGIATTSAHSGYLIRKNLVQNNTTIGVTLRSNGVAPSEVSKNCIRNQSNQDGVRVESATNVELEGNQFNANNQAIDLLDCNCSGLMIEHNDFVGNSFGIVAGHSGPPSSATQVTSSTIEQNKFGSNTFPILANIGANNLHVDHNKSEGDSFGMLFAGASNNVIEKNHVKGTFGSGIQLGFPGSASVPTTANIVSGNKTEQNAFAGLRFSNNAINNTIRDNHSTKNALGIRLDGPLSEDAISQTPQAGGNLIERNKFNENTTVDCSDRTTGGGTAGTANTWNKNKGKTEDRAGLCKNAS